MANASFLIGKKDLNGRYFEFGLRLVVADISN